MKPKKRKARSKSASVSLFVAVVVRADGSPSKRTDGDWASFVGTSRDFVVLRALAAVRKWENGAFGKYEVQVGELTQRALSNVAFELKPLTASALPTRNIPAYDGPRLQLFGGRRSGKDWYHDLYLHGDWK